LKDDGEFNSKSRDVFGITLIFGTNFYFEVW